MYTNFILFLGRILNIVFTFERSMKFLLKKLQFCDFKNIFEKNYLYQESLLFVRGIYF